MSALVWETFVVGLFIVTQTCYAASLGVGIFLRSLSVDKVDEHAVIEVPDEQLPLIVLFYPVLRESEETMRTTMLALERIDYPSSRFRIVAIPNADDQKTLAALHRLGQHFGFLRVLSVPPTSDPTWQVVWDAWEANPKAYWWHKGPRARMRDLPPKKTRQLIYAFYSLAREMEGKDFLVDYIDADSCPPANHFRAAAAGMERFDVLQAQNIAGNCNQSWAATFHAFDHMSWDGDLYPHLSAGGTQPYWVLGKGLFFRSSDLMALGGFHPWTTIEDPEVGMRFWVNGKRLGIIESPLIEEVPLTFAHGITQRKRWVAGFFQSLARHPLECMGMTPWQRFRARLNFVPCLSLWVNALGAPLGLWAVTDHFWGDQVIAYPWLLVGAGNLVVFLLLLGRTYLRTWQRSRLIMPSRRQRALYLLKVNPVFLLVWWLVWLIPLAIGWRMYRRDEGLVWERTVKRDANHVFMRRKLAETSETATLSFPIKHLKHNPFKETSHG